MGAFVAALSFGSTDSLSRGTPAASTRRSTKNAAECGGNFDMRFCISSNDRSLNHSKEILFVKGCDVRRNSSVQNLSNGEAPTTHAMWVVSGRTCKMLSIHFLKSSATATGASFDVSAP